MGSRLRRSLTAILVAVFAASGISSQACLAVQLSTVNASVTPHSHVDAHSQHSKTGMSHGDHQMHGQPPVTDDNQPVADHASKKCCSLCVVSGIQPSTPCAAFVFMVSSDVATVTSRALFDHIVIVDPGIPKRIV